MGSIIASLHRASSRLAPAGCRLGGEWQEAGRGAGVIRTAWQERSAGAGGLWLGHQAASASQSERVPSRSPARSAGWWCFAVPGTPGSPGGAFSSGFSLQLEEALPACLEEGKGSCTASSRGAVWERRLSAGSPRTLRQSEPGREPVQVRRALGCGCCPAILLLPCAWGAAVLGGWALPPDGVMAVPSP